MSPGDKNSNLIQGVIAVTCLCAMHHSVLADGIVVDKIYDPYVQPLETEIEFRSIIQEGGINGDIGNHRLGLGHSIGEQVWAELYLVGVQEPGRSLTFNGVEAELKWQLTEQGEFAFDWGVLIELEREIASNKWELENTLIVVREWGKWLATANAKLIYEWGNRLNDEFETALHLQTRYRYAERFEPAIELHLGQDTIALGPAISGVWRLQGGKKARWQLGIYPGLNSNSPDYSALFSLEYEF